MVFLPKEKIYFVLASITPEGDKFPTKCNVMVSCQQPLTVDDAYKFRSYVTKVIRDKFETPDKKLERIFILSITPL